MDRYRKELAQRTRRMPIYSVPVKYRLKESDRVSFKVDGSITVREIAVNMAPPQPTGAVIKVSSELGEGVVGSYDIYYEDPSETNSERVMMAELAIKKTKTTWPLPSIVGVVKRPRIGKKNTRINELLRYGIDYEIIVSGDVQRVYKPRFNRLNLSEDEVI